MIAASAPSLLALPFEDWQQEWALDAAVVAPLALYAAGAAGVRRWPAWRLACFAAGLAVVVLALQSGIGAWDERLLSDHMVQHMLLLLVAPPLLLAGRPVVLALRALPAHRRMLLGLLRLLRPIGAPWAAAALFCAVILGVHLPAVYDATLRSAPLHELEHALFLLAGLLLFTPLLDADPLTARRLGGIGRVGLLLAAAPSMALVGAYLDRATGVLYAPYRGAAHAAGVSAVLDQQQAGAIMWVAGGTLLAGLGLWFAMTAMLAEERRLRIREARVRPEGRGAP